ncbi:MAG: hypothetical protein ABJH68_11505 [Ilumatobacter sp.]|uniref:hypothetical protein n=1 Tax=Ilumatobacter sp. TaxID=1967498 RepID=UPI0032973A98
MAFGDHSGPPATGRQLRELLELLEAAGHAGYRDARGPMGFTQRQAGGKFTSSEADEFIERLQKEIHGDGPPAGSHSPPRARQPDPSSETTPARIPPPARPQRALPRSRGPGLSELTSEELAAELQRRGWIVVEP